MLLSLIHGIFNNKTGSALNKLALKAKAGDEEVMNDLLFAYAPFMKKTASFVCKKYIDEQNDEFSIAMNGFHEAVLKYNPDKYASLTTFAHLIIKSRLIDYIRKEAVRNENVILLPETSSQDEVPGHNLVFDESSIVLHSEEQEISDRREEIVRYNELLKEYGLSFEELGRTAPKHTDTRKTAFQIAQIITETPDFVEFVITRKRIPIKEIENLVEVSRKTIERHRKYIIAIVLLLRSDFVYIKEYIKGEII